jgi:hypothetical protein
MVFQVKFRRSGEAVAKDWIEATISNELPKIRNLAEQGAVSYTLLTNISGTAHPGSGSIDQGQAVLDHLIPIPSQCLWRDDLNRRLEDAWDIKWSYPDLWSGLDAIHALVEERLSDDKSRRASAIRTFLRFQYDRDEDVRFRQVELRSKLLDLFVDVPARPANAGSNTDRALNHLQINRIAAWISQAPRVAAELPSGSNYVEPPQSEIPTSVYDPESGYSSSDAINGASLLLHEFTATNFPRIVVEGAPGQGKSTLAQYLCQIHRMRMLDLRQLLPAVPADHRLSPCRLPFRVDLRDLATWLRGEDPFTTRGSFTPSPEDLSLEGFLAAQIRFSSGGSAFDVSDLHATVTVTPLLLVLDGLDEVADISERRNVVEAVNVAIGRLDSIAKSMQVVVTSRPAAFANSPGFSPNEFQYYHLTSLPVKMIHQYTGQWATVNDLSISDRGELFDILESKLHQAHMRELARNPMQLTILLSLIHAQGAALPDKRTALYDAYVNTLLNREAEKSAVVRKYRELLVDIHRHLAWVLHSAAERGRSRGSITEEALRDLLRRYLSEEGQDTNLVDELFNGMLERVFALVSRVQGTFEFEVQPLREYFAARHLYETAPYSPTGSEATGTKPDRFDAIVRSSYWLNVTRFYAGCYTKGELADLTERLEELSNEDQLGLTSYPRTVIALLLSDWVFTQYQKGTAELVKLILDPLGIMLAGDVGGEYTGGGGSTFALPKPCGRDTLVERCFEFLASDPFTDVVRQVCGLLAVNADRKTLFEHWRQVLPNRHGLQRERWVSYGAYLDVLNLLGEEEQRHLLLGGDTGVSADEGRAIAFRGGVRHLFAAGGELTKLTLDRILRGDDLVCYRSSNLPLFMLPDVLNPELFRQIRYMHPDMPFEAFSRSYGIAHVGTSLPKGATAEHRAIAALVTDIRELGGTRVGLFESSLAPWQQLVDAIVSRFGKCWRAYEFAHLAGAINSRSDRGSGRSRLFDGDTPLCDRARYARFRSGAVEWWTQQLHEACDIDDRLFWCLCVITWMTPRACASLAPVIEAELASLSSEDYERLIRSVHRYGRENRHSSVGLRQLGRYASLRMLLALAYRLHGKEENRRVDEALAAYRGDEMVVRGFRLQENLARLGRAPVSEALLSEIRADYKSGALSHVDGPVYHRMSRKALTAGLARSVLARPQDYPYSVVQAADEIYRFSLLRRGATVAQIAEREQWF